MSRLLIAISTALALTGCDLYSEEDQQDPAPEEQDVWIQDDAGYPVPDGAWPTIVCDSAAYGEQSTQSVTCVGGVTGPNQAHWECECWDDGEMTRICESFQYPANPCSVPNCCGFR